MSEDTNENAPAPEAPPSAAPTKPAKPKKVKTKYPVPTDGLTEWPADFDEDVHSPLKRSDFKDETVFLEHRAAQYEARAVEIRKEIEEIRTLGVGGKSKAQKLVKVQAELDSLKEFLKAQGMDVDSILAQRAGN